MAWTEVKAAKSGNAKRHGTMVVHKVNTNVYSDIALDVLESAGWDQTTRFNVVVSDDGRVGLMKSTVGLFKVKPSVSPNVWRIVSYDSHNFVLTLVEAFKACFPKGQTTFDCVEDGGVIVLIKKKEA